MRTSAGFFDTGLSGKIRIQIRPPRLMWRVIARRAASLCRDVRRPRSVAFRPYSPKLTLLPTVATPLFRPFCSLRYFLLAGCSILRSWSWSRSPRTLGRFRRRRRRRGGLRVVRHHFALEYPDLDALRAEAHRVLHRALHRAAEHDPLLELLRDRVGNELRVDFGLADLLDVEPDVAA